MLIWIDKSEDGNIGEGTESTIAVTENNIVETESPSKIIQIDTYSHIIIYLSAANTTETSRNLPCITKVLPSAYVPQLTLGSTRDGQWTVDPPTYRGQELSYEKKRW